MLTFEGWEQRYTRLGMIKEYKKILKRLVKQGRIRDAEANEERLKQLIAMTDERYLKIAINEKETREKTRTINTAKSWGRYGGNSEYRGNWLSGTGRLK